MDAAPAMDEPPEARDDISSTASVEPMDPAILHEYLEEHGQRVPNLYHYLHTAKRNWHGRFADEDTCAICLESLNSGYTPNYSELAKALEEVEEEFIDPDLSATDGARYHIVYDWFGRLDFTHPRTDVNGDGNDDPFPLIPHIGLVSRANDRRFLYPTFMDDRILTCAFGHSYHAVCLEVEINSPRSEDRLFQDRCPQCRRRMFADVPYINNRLLHYELRTIVAMAMNLAKWCGSQRPDNGLIRNIETGEAFKLLHHGLYDRGVAAWREAQEAYEQGDVGRFSTAMDEAERIDDELQELEQSFDDDSEDDEDAEDAEDEANVQNEGN